MRDEEPAAVDLFSSRAAPGDTRQTAANRGASHRDARSARGAVDRTPPRPSGRGPSPRRRIVGTPAARIQPDFRRGSTPGNTRP